MTKSITLLFITLLWVSPINSQSTEDIVRNHLLSKVNDFGLSESDISAIYITGEHETMHNGLRHIYFTQSVEGYPVLGTNSSIHLKSNGELVKINMSLVPDFSSRNASGKSKRLSAEAAIRSMANKMKYPYEEPFLRLSGKSGRDHLTYFDKNLFADEDILVEFMFYLNKEVVQPIYRITLYEKDSNAAWEYLVDAESGEIIDQINIVIECQFDHIHVSNCRDNNIKTMGFSTVPENKSGMFGMMSGSYRAFPLGIESPNHGARVLLINPHDDVASPFGWHDTDGMAGPEFTTARGNNTHTYADINNDNTPSIETDGGGGLTFDFSLDLGDDPIDYVDASITNAFVWTNYAHDILYLYGFTEPTGNFQENNYGKGGTGGDYVRTEVQDGGGTNNANMSTPAADGGTPRLQTYLWNHTTPFRDGALDNFITIHEYAHGLTNRLTGGPGINCLTGQERMSEGWSDWYGLMFTMQPGHTGEDIRGAGTYPLGEPIDGPGIRTYPYSTDMTINPHTYDAIKGSLSVPHGVGSVFAAMLWELTWALIDKHGFNPDLYAPWNTGGNNLALQLVTDALKLQGCSPGFVDGRDAILLADNNLTGGNNICEIWNAFAKRGLGLSADQGTSDSRLDGTEAFDTPCITCFQDEDNDGYGNPDIFISSYLTCPAGYVENDLDCDDTNDAINPDAEEICDHIDNNCNGEIDEGLDKWMDQGIGATSNGSAIYDDCGLSDTYTVTSHGFSGPTQDVTHVIYKTLCGDGSITAKLNSISPTGGWASVFMRETLDPGSKKAQIKSRLANFIMRSFRTSTNGPAANQIIFSSSFNSWMRVTRNGAQFSLHVSPDGNNWQFAGAQNIQMSNCISIGMMVESINNATPTTAVFSDVETTGTLLALEGSLVAALITPPISGPVFEVSIAPNPATNKVLISWNSEWDSVNSLMVLDNLGRVMYQNRNQLSQNNLELDVQHFHNGFYTLQILTDNQEYLVKKLIIAR